MIKIVGNVKRLRVNNVRMSDFKLRVIWLTGIHGEHLTLIVENDIPGLECLIGLDLQLDHGWIRYLGVPIGRRIGHNRCVFKTKAGWPE